MTTMTVGAIGFNQAGTLVSETSASWTTHLKITHKKFTGDPPLVMKLDSLIEEPITSYPTFEQAQQHLDRLKRS